jgi:hypothetical protein
VSVGAKFLKSKASSRSTFYGFRSAINVLVWLHSCLDGYSCLLYGECLRNSWYVCCDMVMLVD